MRLMAQTVLSATTAVHGSMRNAKNFHKRTWGYLFQPNLDICVVVGLIMITGLHYEDNQQ